MDEYFSSLPKESKTRLAELKKIIHRAAPQAEEVISYNIPAFKGLVCYAAFKEHVSFFPGSTAIGVFKKELSKYEGSKGTVRLPIDKSIPVGLITKIVKFRLKENAEKAAAKLKKNEQG